MSEALTQTAARAPRTAECFFRTENTNTNESVTMDDIENKTAEQDKVITNREQDKSKPINDIDLKQKQWDEAGTSEDLIATQEQQQQNERAPTTSASAMIVVPEPETLTPSTPSQTPPQVLAASQTTPTAPVAVAAIPENILSPPKSETQTDETNTATSTSSSPASNTQMSPMADQTTTTTTITTSIASVVRSTQEAQPTKVPPALAAIPNKLDGNLKSSVSSDGPIVSQEPQKQKQLPVNGTIPKSGKPLVSALNKKLNRSSSSSSVRSPRTRKPKASLPMYESEISDNKIGIKLCIKKSENTMGGEPSSAVMPPATATTTTKARIPTPPTSVRKRVRKPKPKQQQQRVDSDESEYEPRKKKSGGTNNNGERQKKVSFSTSVKSPNEVVKFVAPVDQSVWGAKIPEEVLGQVFQYVVDKEGCLPTLFRLGRVCSLWRRVSLRAGLWRSLDLTTWIKEKYRTELKLKWFVDNRCSGCTDLNVSNWKVSDINCFLMKLASGCPNLKGITLAGWKGFTSDNLTFLVENMKKLERIDLSSVNVEMNASKSAVGVLLLCKALETMGKRLTHLYLAHNRLAGIPQIVKVLSTHCPNLTLLDLSNVTTQATSHGILHIEKLQHGCQKLRVLRVTNSHVSPSIATMQETMDSPGFPNLEELSVAVLTDESRIFSDDHLQRILKSSSKLKLLDVRNCTRLTHESLIRLPAWDIKHLFLSGCSVTRDVGSGLELIASKWAHSLIELDLAWANVQSSLDNALRALAEKGSESPLAHLNLCGSSVSEDAVKEILANCKNMSSINLASCRGLPRGVKRLMQGPQELRELREVLKVQIKFKLDNAVEDAGGGGSGVDSGGGGGSN